MSNWQDLVLSGGSIVLAAGLLPSIVGEHKPSVYTSVSTGTVLGIFAVVYFSMSMWFAAVTTVVTTGLWATLAVQEIIMLRNHKD
jgi:hypothetical protein